MQNNPEITNKVLDEKNIQNALYVLIQKGYTITKDGYEYRAGIGLDAIDKVPSDNIKLFLDLLSNIARNLDINGATPNQSLRMSKEGFEALKKVVAGIEEISKSIIHIKDTRTNKDFWIGSIPTDMLTALSTDTPELIIYGYRFKIIITE